MTTVKQGDVLAGLQNFLVRDWRSILQGIKSTMHLIEPDNVKIAVVVFAHIADMQILFKSSGIKNI